MTDNRFFTFIWRFNGVVIALAATLILGLVIWELTSDLRRDLFPTRTSEVINVTPSAPDDPTPTPVERTARFGTPAETGSTAIYALPQYVEETYTNRGISKQSGGNLVNYLVVETAGPSTRWLFEGDARLITDVRPLMQGPRNARRLKGHLLHVIEEDTNDNAQLSGQDDGVLYFTDPNWSAPIRLSGDLRRILSARDAGADLIEVIALEASQAVLYRFSLPDGAAVLEMVLPDQN